MKKHDANTALPFVILKGVGIWALAELVLTSLAAALVLGTGAGQDWISNISYVVHAVSVIVAAAWTAGKQKEGKLITTLSVGAAILLVLLFVNLTVMRDGIGGILPVVIPTAAAATGAALISGRTGGRRKHTAVHRRK